MSHRTRTVAFAVPSLLLAAAALLAGPLNPPAGPVTSTYKTLSEVEPRIAINSANTPGDSTSLFIISQPGSYYLTGNITGVVGKHGIKITSSGVTLDLNGFELLGVAASLNGVTTAVPATRNVTVMNGSARSWSQVGVNLLPGTVGGTRALNLTVSDNVTTGLQLGNGGDASHCVAVGNNNGFGGGQGCTFSDCTAYLNAGYGFFLSNANSVLDCTTYDNTNTGIATGACCLVSRCICYSNSASGISVGTGSTVSQCTSRLNATDGVIITGAALALNNTCSSNGQVAADGAGIRSGGSDNRIEGNTCSGQKRGIAVIGSGSIIIRNTCSGNTVANWDIAANNFYGVIIDRTATTTAAVLGNSAASTLGTTDANANFSY